MKKLTKSTKIALIFFLYTTAMAVFLLPRNTEISMTEKVVTIGLSYLVCALLWYVLWRKEQLRKKQEVEDQKKGQEGDSTGLQ